MHELSRECDAVVELRRFCGLQRRREFRLAGESRCSRSAQTVESAEGGRCSTIARSTVGDGVSRSAAALDPRTGSSRVGSNS